MSRLWRSIERAALWFLAGIGSLLLFVLALGTIGWLGQFTDSATLPNGMVLKREFDFSRGGRDDLFAEDGPTPLARGIEFICFNDRHVLVYAWMPGQGGLFDAETGARVSGQDRETVLAGSGLKDVGKTCNGYFTGMIGPSLLYDGMKAPFLPPCHWRNTGNPSLRHRDWFARACMEGAPEARRPAPPGR